MSMVECKRTPKADICGTHKVGSITTTMSKLMDIFGSPEPYHGIDEKVQYQWTLTFEEDGNQYLATIYDWKEYRELYMDEVIEWSIGGHHSMAHILVHDFIEGSN